MCIYMYMFIHIYMLSIQVSLSLSLYIFKRLPPLPPTSGTRGMDAWMPGCLSNEPFGIPVQAEAPI